MEPTDWQSSLSSSVSLFRSLTPENDSPTPRLSLSYLQQVSETEVGADSSYLEAQLNADEIAVDNLGELLPRLRMLRLTDGSIVSSLRCLGSALHALGYLYANQSSVELIEGVGTMGQLKELYLAFNNISDLSPLSVLENLTLLDIECNQVKEPEQMTHLALCKSLSSVFVDGNPVCEKLGKTYRRKLLSLIPNLKCLNGIDSREFSSSEEANDSIVREKLLIARSISNLHFQTPSPPATAPSLPRRPRTSIGPRPKTPSNSLCSDRKSDLRISLGALPQRPSTASGYFRPSSGLSEFLDRDCQEERFENEMSASDLTQGRPSSLCGSLTHSLRSKRWTKQSSKSKLDLVCEGIEIDPAILDNSTAIPSKPPSMDSVLDDLQKWKLRFNSNTDLITDLEYQVD